MRPDVRHERRRKEDDKRPRVASLLGDDIDSSNDLLRFEGVVLNFASALLDVDDQ